MNQLKTQIPPADRALPGRDEPIFQPGAHFVNGRSMVLPYPDGTQEILFGLGCFWGAERIFWQVQGVWVTAVGYAGGYTPNPTYQEICSGQTGHTEAVKVVFDPQAVSLEQLLKLFWESHDPTQGMRQGNDRGTQYRSAIYFMDDAQRTAAEQSRDQYQVALKDNDRESITTEITAAGEFYFAEEYHQQYLAKNPGGYCGLGGTGVTCPGG
ncbi:MAG: peptide-methionine (S)-S-oxide reductase MsrA [Gammaproteobacteria bacterium]